MRGHLQNGLPGEVGEHSLSVSRIQHPVTSIQHTRSFLPILPLFHYSSIPGAILLYSVFFFVLTSPAHLSKMLHSLWPGNRAEIQEA